MPSLTLDQNLKRGHEILVQIQVHSPSFDKKELEIIQFKLFEHLDQM